MDRLFTEILTNMLATGGGFHYLIFVIILYTLCYYQLYNHCEFVSGFISHAEASLKKMSAESVLCFFTLDTHGSVNKLSLRMLTKTN